MLFCFKLVAPHSTRGRFMEVTDQAPGICERQVPPSVEWYRPWQEPWAGGFILTGGQGDGKASRRLNLRSINGAVRSLYLAGSRALGAASWPVSTEGLISSKGLSWLLGVHMFTPQALPEFLLCVALGGFSACSPGPNILTPQNDGAGIPPG